MAAVLSGCAASGGVPASDMTPEELVGAWDVPSHEGVTLVIHDDQTFEMRGWPSNLGCDSPAAEFVEDVAWDDGRDFTGTWQLGPEGYEYDLSLFPDVDACAGVFALSVWHVEGDLVIRDWLGPNADDNSASRLVELSREQ
ncbi:hypothetical protein [Microbacterium sp.]|uniref:hypothetical protein n=1 Tax=Microbacterium sp. TaxID=51671 RepID=UPI003566CE62